jgi:cleavage and polyadenylation specificity factor subunit 2
MLIYQQVRLTDALVSALELKKGKEAELAWLDAQIMVRDMSKDAKPVIMGVDDDEKAEEGMHE